MFFHCEAVRRAIRQSRGGVWLRGDTSGQSGGYQEPHGEWRVRRADELSIVHQNQEVRGIHKRPPTYQELLQVPQWCGAGGIGNAQSAKASSMVLMLFLLSHRHAVHFFVKRHCTDRKDKLLFYAAFLGVNVTDVQRQNCESFLAVGRLSTKRST